MADKCKRSAPTITVVESSPSSSFSSSSSAVMSKRRRTACLAAACKFQPSSSDSKVQDCRSFKSSHQMMTTGSPVNSVNSGDVSSATSCCSCNDEASKVVIVESSSVLDLEAKGFETKDSKYANDNFFSALSEVSGDSEELESLQKSSPALTSYRRIFPTAKMPPEDEIEEFFSVAEKYEQERFAAKYSYDVVKDAPLEGGQYQWVRF